MKPRLSDPPPVAHTLPRPQPPVKTSDYRLASSPPSRSAPEAWSGDKRTLASAVALKLWPFGR
jgi:hypothetical protein